MVDYSRFRLSLKRLQEQHENHRQQNPALSDLNREAIAESVIQRVENCDDLSGTLAWVYGSRVKWASRPQSDLDLVVFAAPEQCRQDGDLREAFEESNLSFRVDLFVWDDMPGSFRE